MAEQNLGRVVGANGAAGKDGTNGTNGFTPTIEVATNTDTEYTLEITNESGSITTPNLKGSGGGGGSTPIVNNLVDGGITSALSAEQGKILNAKLFEVPAPEMIPSGYYNSSGNWSATEDCGSTDFVSLDGVTELRCTGSLSSGGYAVAFFNSNKELLREVSALGVGGPALMTFDLTDAKYADVAFVRVSYYNGSQTYAQYNFTAVYGSAPIVPVVDGIKNLLPNGDSRLNIMLFGDSITDSTWITVNEQLETTSYTEAYDYFWTNLMRNYLDIFDMRNYAHSGAGYYTRPDLELMQNLENQITVAINDLNNPHNRFLTQGTYEPDVIIFALGTNDGDPVDTYESAMAKTVLRALSPTNSIDYDATLANLDTSLSMEAARHAFMRINKQFPKAKKFCVLPLQRADKEQNDFINPELRKMAERYGLNIIDGYAESGIVRDNEIWLEEGVYLNDGLHPNNDGHKQICKMVVGHIKSFWLTELNKG